MVLTIDQWLQVAPVRGGALDAAPVALALDELPDIAGHLSHEKAHRNVGEPDSDGHGDDDCENDG
jgi:hypothetical protein